MGLEDHSYSGGSEGVSSGSTQTDQFIAADSNRSSIDIQEPRRQEQEGALPTAARSGEQNLLPRLNREFRHGQPETVASLEFKVPDVQGCCHADMLRPKAFVRRPKSPIRMPADGRNVKCNRVTGR